jgi:hypothetical protein
MMGGDKAQAGTQSFGDTGKDTPTPWGGAPDSGLAREAGLNDIGGAREDRQGSFDNAQHIADDPGGDGSDGGDGGFDVGGDGGGDGDSEA